MFSKTNLSVHKDSLVNFSPTEREVLTEIQEKLDGFSILDSPPTEFTLYIEECCWPDRDHIEISPEAVSAITALVLNRLQSLSVSFTLNFDLCSLGNEGAIALAEILKESSGKNLTLDLFLCSIEEEGFLAIAKALASETCMLSGLTLRLGKQIEDYNDIYGIHDTVNGQIQLIEVLSSPYCPDGLIIDFKFLTPEYADKIVTAMQFNTSSFIEFENRESTHGKDVVLLNKRNRLLNTYPAYKEQITSFCQAQLGFRQTDSSTPLSLVLSLHTNKKYDEQIPQELVQFFSSVLNIEADRAEEAKILTIDIEPFSSYKNSITNLSSLSIAINANTEFTVFTKPLIPNIELNEVVNLLKQTALRNRFIKDLTIEKNEMLLEAAQFSLQLLQALYDKKSKLSPEINNLVLQYFSLVLSDLDNKKAFGSGTHFIQAVKTGLIPLANKFYHRLLVNDIFDREELYLSAIESGTEEMMLWLHSLSKREKFLSRETLNLAEKKLSNYGNKENLGKGLIIFKKLLLNDEKQEIQNLIEARNTDNLELFLKNREIDKATLATFLSLAISQKLNRSLLRLIIGNLGEHFEINNLSGAEFVYLTNFGLISPAQREHFLKHNYSDMTKELTLQLIRKRNYPRQFLGLFIELHLNNLTPADVFSITQNYSLAFLHKFKDNFIQSLSEKFPGNKIIQEIAFAISELIQKENSLRLQVLPVFENEKIELSSNKREFIDSKPVSLSNNQVYQVAQSYQRRKKIRIYVEGFLPTSMQDVRPEYKSEAIKNRGVNSVLHIQNALAENEYAGYVYVEGSADDSRGHVECLIATKTQVIKPVSWSIKVELLYTHHYDRAASTNLSEFASITLIPQASMVGCESLSLVYLKELLKDDARQLKELCFIFPYNSIDSQKLDYFFIPSPQVLRYSQSTAYNLYIKKLVTEDESGFITHKDKQFTYTPIKHLLVELQLKSQKEENFELVEEIESLLDQLPHFRKRWLHAYEQMDSKRSLMHHSSFGSFNTGLQYTTRRMRKLALIEEENIQNPGLSLLNFLEEKKKEGYSNEELLVVFSERISILGFERAFEIGYFINNLAKLIESEAIYSIFFSYEANLSLIKKPVDFKDCLFFLDPNQRKSLRSYFKESPFSQLLPLETIAESKGENNTATVGFGLKLFDASLEKRTTNPETDELDSGSNMIPK
jgi:hypothetical protein